MFEDRFETYRKLRKEVISLPHDGASKEHIYINALSFIKRADEQIVVRFETDAEGMTEFFEELIKRLEKFKEKLLRKETSF